jgi:hypothetical protein
MVNDRSAPPADESACSKQRVQTQELFNHFVGKRKQLVGNDQAQRFGSLEVDHQIEFGRLYYRQLPRVGTAQDSTGIDTSLTI